MDDDDLDRLLLTETDGVEPSPTFLVEVMAAAQRRAAAPPPLPFPWKWAGLGLGAMLAASVGGLSIAGPELVQAALRSGALGPIEMLLAGLTAWVPAMVLVTLSATAGCVRSLRAVA